jgi:hypothetical protein
MSPAGKAYLAFDPAEVSLFGSDAEMPISDFGLHPIQEFKLVGLTVAG